MSESFLFSPFSVVACIVTYCAAFSQVVGMNPSARQQARIATPHHPARLNGINRVKSWPKRAQAFFSQHPLLVCADTFIEAHWSERGQADDALFLRLSVASRAVPARSTERPVRQRRLASLIIFPLHRVVVCASPSSGYSGAYLERITLRQRLEQNYFSPESSPVVIRLLAS